LRRVFALIIGLALLISLAACTSKPAPTTPAPAPAPAPKPAEKLKMAFVYVGPIGDGGWTFEHEKGRLMVEKELAGKVETTYLESVPEGADAERVFEELAQKGNKVIWGTSFGYMDAMEKVAKKYPNVIFMHNSGYKLGANLGNYFGRNHDAFYLAGIVGGLQSKTSIGMVAAYPIPEVIRAINAFTLGARSVNPAAKVKVVWTNTWYDPAKEKTAALSLLDVGADMIAMYQDSPGPLQAAQERGKTAIGNDSDARQHAPKAFLTAPVWNWGPYYVKITKDVLDGKWKSESYWGSVKDGIVDLAPLADFAPKDAKAKVDEAKKKLNEGSLVVFKGPIKDQTGKEKVASGVALKDDELLSMSWFVEGVDGVIPK